MPQGEHDGLSEELEMKTAIAVVFLKGHTIQFLALIAVAVVAITLSLSAINALAEEDDDRPRLGETTLEYKARTARTQADRAAAVRGLQEKAHRDAQEEARREAEERLDAANKRYDKAVRDYERTVNDQRARARRAREIECNRLSQRAALDWSASAARHYETYCAD
jgi:hypothetical protein